MRGYYRGKLIAIALLALCGGCLYGCQAHGHRKVTVALPFLGTITVEDQTYNDETGKPNFNAGFSPEMMAVLMDLFVRSKTDGEKETGAGAATEGENAPAPPADAPGGP